MVFDIDVTIAAKLSPKINRATSMWVTYNIVELSSLGDTGTLVRMPANSK